MSASALLFGLCLAILLSLSGASPFDPSANFGQCKANFLNGGETSGAVDLYGNNVSSLHTAQGLRYPECYSLCGDGWQREPWLQVSAYLATWLFPWIALVGQLPFQTSWWFADCLSASLVVGSPILAMQSLLLTLSNSRWIYRTCRELANRDGQRETKNMASRRHDEKQMENVAFVLSACQQVPLRIPRKAHLAYSIILKRNEKWWGDLADHLRDTARVMPESLWPQMALVIVTYVFTLVAAFSVLGGNPSNYLTKLYR